MQVTGEEAGVGGGIIAVLLALVGIVRSYIQRKTKREDIEGKSRLLRDEERAAELAARREKTAADRAGHEERRTRAAELEAAAQVETAKALTSLATSVSQVALEVRDTREDVKELREDIRDWTPVHGIERLDGTPEATVGPEDDTPVHSPRAAARAGTGGGFHIRRGAGGKDG